MNPAQRNQENLRRSTRTVVLQQQLKPRSQTQNEEKKEAKKTDQAKEKNKKKSLKKKKAKILKLRNSSKKMKKKDDDDGFILDDPANNVVSAQPLKEFDELELWRRYQKDGNEGSQDPDDGFILDVGDAAQGLETSRPQFPENASIRPASLVRKKQKYMKKEIQVTAGKKLSKKKRKRAERKWLKKLFHESVIIAEPQDAENNNQSGALSSAQSPEDTPETAVTVAVDTSTPMEITHTAETHSPCHELKTQTKQTISSESFLTNNVTTIYKNPSVDTDKVKRSNVVNGERSQPLTAPASKVYNGKGKPETVASEDGRKLRADWERALKESGMSNFEWSQHLLNLHEIHCKSCSHSLQHHNSSTEGDLSTTYVDMTSGKSDPDDRKKRYKMELSLPEGTTILVTNLVERDSKLPKVIFMLKKTTANGEMQESPLLMGCSNDSSKQKDQSKSNANLESELQEIAKQFLRVQSGVVSSSNANDPLLSIPKALEFNMV
ncbi:hypothetical protein HOLleu_05904 [Holothuria leucospilota]|uniref:Uncharacterized protein n=1 Tax=Holothuria leucospilota TaxID=206669 RepID=A0A9Q1HJ84_HOLLE|nr:hypothetical protein HOLleu_05904 [Holothuria leucospilota]